VWFVGFLAGWSVGGITQTAIALSFAIALVASADWAFREGSRHPFRRAILLALLAVLVATTAAAWGRWGPCLAVAALVSAGTSIVLSGRRTGSLGVIDWWEPIFSRPERLLVATFLTLCIVGSILLLLPVTTTSEGSIPLLDASFTAVSAVCVTGLIVLDTPVDFTPLGQAVILLLIQLGGIGIMTFSAAAFQLLGRRMSLRHEGVIAKLINAQDRSQLSRTTYRVIRFTFAAEAVGVALLIPPFIAHGDSFGQAAWRAVFTAVSAFCNAGFALQSDSLIGYAGSAWILHVVGALIVIGGLSPAVAVAVPHIVRRTKARISVEARIALCATLVLLVAGFVYVLATEWTNTLAGLSVWDRINNGWFQSVTLRTAGFNSVDIGALQPATITIMIIWMFIGGSPGGTAGGIKTTTAVVLVLALVSAIRGRWIVTFLGRRMSHETVYKAGAVATLGLASVVAGFLALQLTQSMPTGTALFEIVSALGTVGLSTGGTPLLDGVGKVIIIGAMFIGRVGPLTLFLFLTERQSRSEWQRPEEEIEVG
jgi:trk system potassium uptake protein TrkH